MLDAGHRLRALREQLGLTVRAVESASMKIADRHGNDAYIVPLSRLSDIETKGVVPSVYRFYSLAAIYRRNPRELLGWYGIDVNDFAADLPLADVPRSHTIEAIDVGDVTEVPVRLDARFDPGKTVHMGAFLEKWGPVPLSFLSQLTSSNYTYAYVGSEDRTMYPLLLPGSFVQIDESKSKVQQGGWRSEFERPIYFVETRDGYSCCWCSLGNGSITLQSHPLSGVPVRVLRHPREAEVIGQVVGVAMRLGESPGVICG